MRMILSVLLVALLGACDSGASDEGQLSKRDLLVSFQQVGYHPGLRRDLGTYFVVADLQGTSNDQAYQDFLSIGRGLCQDKSVCFVHFWTDYTRVAKAIPMTNEQASAMVASYNKNVNSGNDTLVCHPFGSAGESCS